MVFLLIIIFIAIILFEAPDMVMNKNWHELKVFYIFLGAAFLFSLFYVANLPIPNPIKGMEFVVKDILHLNYK